MPLMSGDGVDQGPPAEFGESKRRLGVQTPWPTSASAQSGRGSDRKGAGYDVAGPSLEHWERQDRKIVARHYTQIQRDFFAIILEYVEDANALTTKSKDCEKSHAHWGFWIIIATGLVAVINVCAALNWGELEIPSKILPPIAAVGAVCLTAARHAEKFFNWGEKATGFREARELLLNRYFEYRLKWLSSVAAYGQTPIACLNAGRLYRQLIESDQELRQNLKQLTKVKRADQAVKSAAGHS